MVQYGAAGEFGCTGTRLSVCVCVCVLIVQTMGVQTANMAGALPSENLEGQNGIKPSHTGFSRDLITLSFQTGLFLTLARISTFPT
jgi:hypothetical protein